MPYIDQKCTKCGAHWKTWHNVHKCRAKGCDGTIVPAGGDPHSFEPSLKDREAMGDATLIVANGLGLEESMADIVGAVDAPTEEEAAAEGGWMNSDLWASLNEKMLTHLQSISLRQLVAEQIGPNAAQVAETDHFAWDTFHLLGREGVIASAFPREYGGTAASMLAR